MQQKGKNPKLNQRGEFKTWHFTSVLTLTHEIHACINWLAIYTIIVVDAQYLLVKTCSKAKVMNKARQACVTFISWRFSHVDAKLWISNATAKLPLQVQAEEEAGGCVGAGAVLGWREGGVRVQ